MQVIRPIFTLFLVALPLYVLSLGGDPPDYTNVVIVYRGTWLVVLYVFLCGVNVFVWEKYNINYLQIFSLEAKGVSYFMDFFEAAATLAFLWSLGIILYLWTSSSTLSFGLGFSPLALSLLFWVIILSPSNIFYKHTRQWIFNHVASILWGPYAVTNFASCWVADQFTSATVALVDFEYTICHYFLYIGGLNCDSLHRILQPICVAFPFIWRLMQCLIQYRDSSNTNHLLNAGKYATSLCAIFFSTIHLITQENPNSWSVFRTYWVMAISLSTMYSYMWDIIMDWGLFTRDPYLYPHHHPHHHHKSWHFREVLIYERPMVYYFAMVTNLFMRTTWMITLNPEYFGIHFRRDILVFFLASVELVRRIQWNFFRMEYEHIVKSGGNKFSDGKLISDSKQDVPSQ